MNAERYVISAPNAITSTTPTANAARSRPSNRRHSEEFRNAALDLIRERYLDFGPTLAREKLIELWSQQSRWAAAA